MPGSRLVRSLAVVVALTALAAPAFADEGARALEGTWKRKRVKAAKPGESYANEPFFVRLDLDPASGDLKGKILNPPENKPAYVTEVVLKRDGKSVTGTCTWTQPGEGSREPFSVPTSWKLEVKGEDKLEGTCEWGDWEPGKVHSRGEDAFVFERVERDSLGTGPAPEKVEAAQPIDARALDGVWRNPVSGGLWCLKAEGDGFTIVGPDGKDNGNGDIKVVVERGLLVGKQAVKGGADKIAFELALSADGKLAGRALWTDLETGKGAEPQEGWYGFGRERLPRLDGPTFKEAVALKPYAEAPAPPTNLRRADGLYLVWQAVPDQGEHLHGELRTREGEVKATVKLARADGTWKGTAAFTTAEGAKVELGWTLGSPDEKGVHGASLEAGDYDPAAKKVVRKTPVDGWSFARLRRIE